MIVIANNEHPSVCAKCGGACCRTVPGTFAPEDFGAPDLDALRHGIGLALDLGAQIDWWQGNPILDDDSEVRCYFVRAPIAGERRLYSPTWGGMCGWLRPSGCVRPFDERPAACRAVVVSRHLGKNCDAMPGFDKQTMCAAWWPLRDLVEQVADAHPRREPTPAFEDANPRGGLGLLGRLWA